MTWHLGRMAGFDLETTGVDVETDRIVTACVVQCGGSHPTQSSTWMANPGINIPEGAAKVHGITTEQAQADGQPAGEVVQQIVAALTQVVLAGIPVVAMNAAFDLTMLDREARRHRVYPLADSVGEDLRVIDPYVIDKQVDTYRKGPRKLTDLCAHYDVRLDGAHTADADAIAACRVVWRLGQRYEQLAAMSLGELHKAQVDWAAEQAASLQEYLRRKDSSAYCAPEWPLVPAQRGGAA
jgi:DNA polymerase-3 subunit epsilon